MNTARHVHVEPTQEVQPEKTRSLECFLTANPLLFVLYIIVERCPHNPILSLIFASVFSHGHHLSLHKTFVSFLCP